MTYASKERSAKLPFTNLYHIFLNMQTIDSNSLIATPLINTPLLIKVLFFNYIYYIFYYCS